MAQATFHFPRGFLWGTATAAYQVEGNNPIAIGTPGNRNQGGSFMGIKQVWPVTGGMVDGGRIFIVQQKELRTLIACRSNGAGSSQRLDRWDEDALNRYVEMVRGLGGAQHDSTYHVAPLLRPAMVCGTGGLGK